MSDDVLSGIRDACAKVARRARSVRVDEEAFASLVARWTASPPSPPRLDPAHHHLGDDEATLAYLICLDAVNFGSGYFPHLKKRPGLSGYFTVATSLRERFAARGPFDAGELRSLDGAACAALFGQDLGVPEAAELMDLFAEALRDLGRLLESRYGGRFADLVEEASGSAERLVELLCAMPFYRDVARYDELEVPFYKRAQLTAADLSVAFEGRGWGAFHDLDRLTIFADNLVPHVLRCEGVLVYAPSLAERIDAEALIAAGAPEEVEIRACALHTVERCVAALRAAGVATSAYELDTVLWSNGQAPEFKARPRHRARCVYY